MKLDTTQPHKQVDQYSQQLLSGRMADLIIIGGGGHGVSILKPSVALVNLI